MGQRHHVRADDEGWLYLAVVLDLASRRVIGWSMDETLEAEGAIRALHAAIARRRPPAGLIHHSDRGGQYACGAYQAVLAAHGSRASMSRKGVCWDNAVAESCFATLEQELIMRRHSTLGYLSPAVYEAQRRAA